MIGRPEVDDVSAELPNAFALTNSSGRAGNNDQVVTSAYVSACPRLESRWWSNAGRICASPPGAMATAAWGMSARRCANGKRRTHRQQRAALQDHRLLADEQDQPEDERRQGEIAEPRLGKIAGEERKPRHPADRVEHGHQIVERHHAARRGQTDRSERRGNVEKAGVSATGRRNRERRSGSEDDDQGEGWNPSKPMASRRRG